MKKALLNVDHVSKTFPVHRDFLSRLTLKNFRPRLDTPMVHVLNKVSFTVRKGETFAIVGESGCGKSTLARTITGLYSPSSGNIWYGDTEISTLSPRQRLLFCRKIQMIFQDPYSSLNPRKKVRDIVGQPLDLHGKLSRSSRRETIAGLLEQVGLDPDYAHRYPHQFSGGQRQRIGIARALAARPEFIVADEPTSALDVSVQAQILNLLIQLQREYNLSYILVSHNLSVIRHLSDRVAVMYMGTIVEMGEIDSIFNDPRHPYTRMLFSAIPTLDHLEFHPPEAVTGEVRTLFEKPQGCPFFHRCPRRLDRCRESMPREMIIHRDHMVRCHLYSR